MKYLEFENGQGRLVIMFMIRLVLWDQHIAETDLDPRLQTTVRRCPISSATRGQPKKFASSKVERTNVRTPGSGIHVVIWPPRYQCVRGLPQWLISALT